VDLVEVAAKQRQLELGWVFHDSADLIASSTVMAGGASIVDHS
jgi:hypothetical protein